MAGVALRPPNGAAPTRAPRAPWPAARVIAAALSLGVAWVHFVYMGSHFGEWWAYGAFFLAAGVGQALLAPLILRRPRPWLVAAGIAGNLAIVGMYVVSRTAGPPLGPHARVPEPAGAVDLATTVAEIVLVGVLLSMLYGRARRLTGDAVLGFAVLLWTLRLTGHLP